MEEENLVENARTQGAYFIGRAKELMEKYPEKIVDVRGAGLLIGIELKVEIAGAVFREMFEKGFLTSLCHTTLRLAPPLIIQREEIDRFIRALEECLQA